MPDRREAAQLYLLFGAAGLDFPAMVLGLAYIFHVSTPRAVRINRPVCDARDHWSSPTSSTYFTVGFPDRHDRAQAGRRPSSRNVSRLARACPPPFLSIATFSGASPCRSPLARDHLHQHVLLPETRWSPPPRRWCFLGGAGDRARGGGGAVDGRTPATRRRPPPWSGADHRGRPDGFASGNWALIARGESTAAQAWLMGGASGAAGRRAFALFARRRAELPRLRVIS